MVKNGSASLQVKMCVPVRVSLCSFALQHFKEVMNQLAQENVFVRKCHVQELKVLLIEEVDEGNCQKSDIA